MVGRHLAEAGDAFEKTPPAGNIFPEISQADQSLGNFDHKGSEQRSTSASCC